jgi:hypothetical protein
MRKMIHCMCGVSPGIGEFQVSERGSGGGQRVQRRSRDDDVRLGDLLTVEAKQSSAEISGSTSPPWSSPHRRSIGSPAAMPRNRSARHRFWSRQPDAGDGLTAAVVRDGTWGAITLWIT